MIIFLYGEDSFRSNQKIKELKERFFKTDPTGSGLSVVDFSDSKEKVKLIDILQAGNLFSPKRLVIAKNLIVQGKNEEQEVVLEYLKKNQKFLTEDKELIVVFWEGTVPRKNNAIFKFLEKNSKKQNLEKLVGIKLDQWAGEQVKERGGKISREGLAKLTAYVGQDMYALSNEIKKLVSYADKREIQPEDVEKLVRANLSGNIFETIDALGNGDKAKAFRLLHRHLENGEDPFYLFSMIVYQFRNLIQVASFKEEGMPEFEIARASKLHPFVVKKSLSQLRRFSFSDLKKTYQKLSDLDTQVKTGRLNMELAIDLLIISL